MAEHFKNPMSQKIVTGYTQGEFLILTPEGAEDYRVGVKEVKMEKEMASYSQILWLVLHDGRKVRIKIPQPVLTDYYSL